MSDRVTSPRFECMTHPSENFEIAESVGKRFFSLSVRVEEIQSGNFYRLRVGVVIPSTLVLNLHQLKTGVRDRSKERLASRME